MKISRTFLRVAAVSCIVVASPMSWAAEFLVGVEVPLTGKLARAGSGMYEGVQVAAAVFNAKHPQHRIELIKVDNESQPAKAVAGVEWLASKDVLAITGGYGSNLIAPASETAEKAGLVYVTSGGVDPSLTEKGLKNFFRINNIDGYSKAVIGLLDTMDVKSASILYSTKDATTDLAKEVEHALKAAGRKVHLHAFDPHITDFKPVMNKVRLLDKPDVVVMSGYENDYVGIIRAAKVLKPDVDALVGVWSLATPKMAEDFPDLMPNVYGTASMPDPPVYTSAEGQEFAAEYEALFDKNPDYVAQFGYVQSQLLFDAILRAHETGRLDEPGAIAEEMRQIDQSTLIGRVAFNAQGDNPHFTHRMGQHQSGNVVLVWPDSAATGEMKYPGVPW